jgi:hypothetical protein
MGDVDEELNFILSQKYYQFLLNHFEFLLQNLQYVSSLLLAMSLFFSVVFIDIVNIYVTTD